MTEERITEVKDPNGEGHSTTTTIVTDGEARSRGGASWVLLLVLLVAVIGAIFLFSNIGGAEVAKDNAIAEAADSVGSAAGQIGDAAQQAGDAVENAAGGE